jgi:hypothetical protein
MRWTSFDHFTDQRLYVLCYVMQWYRYQGYHSPYYHDGHKKLRAVARKFVEELKPNVDNW